jgi:hypothetical protein
MRDFAPWLITSLAIHVRTLAMVEGYHDEFDAIRHLDHLVYDDDPMPIDIW